MSKPLNVAVIGDFNPKAAHHTMTNESLQHSARKLVTEIEIEWVPTDAVQFSNLKQYDAIWCSSGSPYKSMSGAISAIQFAREKDWPFFAT
jgi:CTP synthase (UTP-ammonia lyase)